MPASPCVNICRMEDGLCLGCWRRIDEIAAWGNATASEKKCILRAVAQRRAKAETEPNARRGG